MAKTSKSTNQVLSAESAKLLTVGKNQGFLTLDDILKIFPNAESNMPEVEELYYQLQENNVDVFEDRRETLRREKVTADIEKKSRL